MRVLCAVGGIGNALGVRMALNTAPNFDVAIYVAQAPEILRSRPRPSHTYNTDMPIFSDGKNLAT